MTTWDQVYIPLNNPLWVTIGSIKSRLIQTKPPIGIKLIHWQKDFFMSVELIMNFAPVS